MNGILGILTSHKVKFCNNKINGHHLWVLTYNLTYHIMKPYVRTLNISQTRKAIQHWKIALHDNSKENYQLATFFFSREFNCTHFAVRFKEAGLVYTFT